MDISNLYNIHISRTSFKVCVLWTFIFAAHLTKKKERKKEKKCILLTLLFILSYIKLVVIIDLLKSLFCPKLPRYQSKAKRKVYSLYDFKLAVTSTLSLLDTLTKHAHKPNPTECIRTRARKRNVPANTHNDHKIASASLPTWNCTDFNQPLVVTTQ